MKILLVAPTYLPSRRANTIQSMKMAQAAKELGHHIRVLVPDTGKGRVLDWETIAHHYGLRQKFEIEWLTVSPIFRGYDYAFKVVSNFQRWNGADILYTRLPQAAALASLLNIPTIFEVHDLPGGYFGGLLFRLFLKGRGGRRLVLITQSLKDAISASVAPIPDTPFSIIAPDGVDQARYQGIREPEETRQILHREGFHQLPISRFTIGYTGHLYPGRGVGLILDIASRLPQFSFLIVGGDPRAVRDVMDDVNRLRLENVILTGFVPNADLPLYQAACDLFLMPYQRKVSASSGGDIGRFLSPMKLFEYLACGRVILSSCLPVLSEVLNDRNAILLPPDDTNAWVKAILEIQDDQPRQNAIISQAQEDSRLYTWEARAERIFSVES